MMNVPQEITNALLHCIVMPNGEVICNGRTIGYVGELSSSLYIVERGKLLAGLTIERKRKKAV